MSTSCTSQIKVIKDNCGIHVEWQKIHYGHSSDLQHIRLPNVEKQNIATKLINGVTPRRILKSTRDNIVEHLKRIDLLTSKDIRNIKTSYGVESKDGRRHSNDALSIDLWVRQCESLDENPVLLYKPQGKEHDILKKEDFCLIIMNKFQRQMIKKFPNIITVDSTHGLNAYDFEMTTVMVIDEFHHGFPVAIMFSNRKDTAVQSLFFSSIKGAVGVVSAGIFMSDMAESFYNAWVVVMGIGSDHLFCSWHVDRAWQSNLNKIKDKDNRAEVYKILKTLQQRTLESNFGTALDNAIKYMCSDEASKNFGEYFKNMYFRNFRKWAYCFRKKSSINTNMHLESMHKVIKYFYLERKTVKPLDKGLNAILQYVRDITVERLIRLTKGENTKLSRELSQNHKEAVKNCDNYMIIDYNSFWKISKNEKKNYLIHKKLDKKCCEHICMLCNLCNHMYSCDCEFHMERGEICKHIHMAISKLQLDQRSKTANSIDCDNSTSVSKVLATLTQQSSREKENIETAVKTLIGKLDEINYQELDDSILSQLHHHLMIINKLSMCSTLFKLNDSFEVKENASKRVIDTQIRFTSTKKKRVEANTSLKRATEQEALNIQENLKHTSPAPILFKSVSSLYDHQYCKK